MSRRYVRNQPGAATVLGMGLAAVAIAAALYLAIIAVGAFILSWGWNLVVPTTFGGPTLDFGGAFALLVVFAVIRAFLFGGVRKS